MTPSSGAAPRGRLLRKYVVVFVGLVGGVLMASSLVELYFAYQQTKAVIVREERATAVATAAKIEEFTRDIERRVREITQAASDDPAAAQLGLGKLAFRGELGAALTEQRELDFLRLLRDVPAISELSHLDVSGKEQIRVARLALDAVGSQEDFSQTPKFRETRSGKTYWSPVYFRSGAQPYLTLAVPVGQYAVEVTTAEISLKPVQRAIAQVQAGRGGYAYVVDSRGRLFAHPDIGLVRQNRDLSGLPQVSDARAARPAAQDAATVAEGLQGGQILAAHASDPVPRVGRGGRTAARRSLRSPAGPDRPEHHHLRSRPRPVHPGQRAPRPAHGRADPDAAGRRVAHRSRRPRPSRARRHRRRARGPRQRAEPDRGPARGVLRHPGEPGRGADARARRGEHRD